MYNAKELKLNIKDKQINYITFGKGSKPLIMIQGLNTNGIQGRNDWSVSCHRQTGFGS